MDYIGYIYRTKNLVNNKIYIGQHRSKEYDEKYFGSGIILLRAIKKYGKESFINDIIEWCYTEDELNKKELHYIKVYNSLTPIGYNIRPGGNQSPLNDISKRKISLAHQGKRLSDDHKRKISAGVLKAGINPNKKMLYGKDNPMYGVSMKDRMKTHNDYEKWKKSCSRPGPKNGMYGISPQERMDKETYEIWRKKISKRSSGKGNGMYGKPSPGRKPIVGIYNKKEYYFSCVKEWEKYFQGKFTAGVLRRYLRGKNTKINKSGWVFYFKEDYDKIL